MHDKGMVFTILFVFLALVAFPFWYGAASGAGEERLAPEKPDGERCVAAKDYMTAAHMELLNEWRDRVVRDKRK